MLSVLRPIAWLPLLAAGFLSSCGDSKEEEARIAQLKAERILLDEQLREAQARLAEIKADVEVRQQEVAEIRAEADALPEKIEAVRPYRAELAVLLPPMNQHLDLWKKATRDSLRGMSLGDIELAGGQFLENVIIVEITDNELKVSANGQPATIDPYDLPEEMRIRLVDESLVKTDVGPADATTTAPAP